MSAIISKLRILHLGQNICSIEVSMLDSQYGIARTNSQVSSNVRKILSTPIAYSLVNDLLIKERDETEALNI